MEGRRWQRGKQRATPTGWPTPRMACSTRRPMARSICALVPTGQRSRTKSTRPSRFHRETTASDEYRSTIISPRKRAPFGTSGKEAVDRENPYRDKGKHGGGALDDGPAAQSTEREEQPWKRWHWR